MIELKLLSFGYEYGIPKQPNKIYNVRQYPCPSIQSCKKYNGTHKVLQNELIHLQEFQKLFETILSDIDTLINESDASDESGTLDASDESKQNIPKTPKTPNTWIIVIAIGCDHGKHRSVCIVERLQQLLTLRQSENHQIKLTIEHRDLHRKKQQRASQLEKQRQRQAKYNVAEDCT